MTKRNEIAELHHQGRIRNRLLAGKTLQRELVDAADRVMRLSEPGTSERFFTLTTVADETGFNGKQIVDAIRHARKRGRGQSQQESK